MLEGLKGGVASVRLRSVRLGLWVSTSKASCVISGVSYTSFVQYKRTSQR